jgi:uncharacterized protein YciI
MAAFLVTFVHGPTWDPTLGRTRQAGWDEHAAFMNGLVASGFVVLGGPVGDGTDVACAVEAEDEATVRGTLAEDPWADGVLALGSVVPWQLWMDGRRR